MDIGKPVKLGKEKTMWPIVNDLGDEVARCYSFADACLLFRYLRGMETAEKGRLEAILKAQV